MMKPLISVDKYDCNYSSLEYANIFLFSFFLRIVAVYMVVSININSVWPFDSVVEDSYKKI